LLQSEESESLQKEGEEFLRFFAALILPCGRVRASAQNDRKYVGDRSPLSIVGCHGYSRLIAMGYEVTT
jgi:hypothetical protein